VERPTALSFRHFSLKRRKTPARADANNQVLKRYGDNSAASRVAAASGKGQQ